MILDSRQHVTELEPRQDDDGGARAEEPRCECREAVDVEHRNRAYESLFPSSAVNRPRIVWKNKSVFRSWSEENIGGVGLGMKSERALVNSERV